jgi:hypothetical protein
VATPYHYQSQDLLFGTQGVAQVVFTNPALTQSMVLLADMLLEELAEARLL